MFHVGPVYFRKNSVNAYQDPGSTGYDGHIFKRDLLFALESARSHLAIAIAGESKSTPADLRKHYMDTTDRIQLHIRRLRNGRRDLEWFCPPGWMSALEALRRIPLKGTAQTLCDCICQIMAEFE